MKEKILELLAKAKKLRQPHETEIRDAYALVKPSRSFDEKSQGASRPVIFDATLRRSTRNLVTNILRLLIPQNRRWADITIQNQFRKTVGTQLDRRVAEANEFMFRYYLQSNFFLAVTESLWDAAISGVGCLLIIDRDGEPVEFQSIPSGELYFLQNADGHVDTVFRCFTLSRNQLLGKYPGALEGEEKPETDYKLIQACVPCDGRYEWSVFLERDMEILEKKKTPWNPFVVYRWERDTDSPWGDSPVRAALPHGRVVNQMVRDNMLYGEYASKGLWQTADESLNVEHLRGQLKPGSVIALDTPLEAVPFPGNFSISLEMIRMEQESIKGMMMDNSLPSEDSLKYMTAEAVVQQQTQFLQYIGEPAQRLAVELLQPLGEQVTNRLMLRGDLVVLTLEEVYGLDIEGVKSQYDLIRVDVNAAIHRANAMTEAANSINAVMRVSQVAQSMGINPSQVAVQIDTDRFIRETLVAFDFDPELLRDEKEAKTLTDEMGGQAQMMQMLQMAGPAAKAAKDAKAAGLLPEDEEKNK